jgi:hypothetical protein
MFQMAHNGQTPHCSQRTCVGASILLLPPHFTTVRCSKWHIMGKHNIAEKETVTYGIVDGHIIDSTSISQTL